jgi:hypothetical protein
MSSSIKIRLHQRSSMEVEVLFEGLNAYHNLLRASYTPKTLQISAHFDGKLIRD